MVVIKQFNSTEFAELPSITGRLLYDNTLNLFRFNNATSYNNIIVSKDNQNNVSSINNLSIDGNLGINTSNPEKKVEINSATGDCLRLTYNDNNGLATNFTDFVVSSSGDLTITPSGNDITISGALTVSDDLTIQGAFILAGTDDATSSTNGGSLTVSGGAAVAKKLFVGTDLNVGGNTSLTGTLGVTGATTLSSTLGVTGATTLSSTLGVTGATTLSSTTDATSSTVGGALTISGGTAIAKKLFVGTDLSIGGNSTLSGTLGVTGTTTLSSTLGVTGATTLSSTLGVTGATTLSSTLEVTGATTLTSLTVTGALIFSSTTDATSSTDGGALTIAGGTAIAKKLFVGTDLNIGGNTTLTGNVGIGTSSPDRKLEINSATGSCLRLTFDDSDGTATAYADLLIAEGGELTITPSSGNVNISSHNGSTTGLKLNGTLVTATAAELNYVDTTVGVAIANKALIADADRNITSIAYMDAEQIAVIKPNTANNTVDYPISLITTPNTTAGVGLGTGIEFNSVNDNDDIYNAGYINYISSNITSDEETGYFDFKLANDGVIDSIMTVANNGVVTCTSFVETSDERVKENIQLTNSEESLEKLLQINVKTYNFIKDNQKKSYIGIIAQELKEILPDLVVIQKNDQFDDFHTIHYTELIPHLINCIKELNNKLEDLKKSQ
jgi:hypothetical protein